MVVVGALALGWAGLIPAWLMWSVAIGATVIVVVDFVLTLRESRAATSPDGAAALVGKTVIARSPIDPEGFVFIDGERWLAEMEDGRADEGERLVIVEAHGLHLRVRRAP